MSCTNFHQIIMMNICFLLFGCNNNVEITERVNFKNINGLNEVEADWFLDDIELSKYRDNYNIDVEYIQLETSSACLIGKIDKIYQYDDKLIILDKDGSNSLFIFDIDGKFINKIGARGKGKGEYLIVSDFDMNETEKYIYLYDNILGKIIVYTFDNEFVREIRIPFNSPRFLYLNNSFCFNTNKYPNLDKYKYHIIITDMNGSVIDKIIPFNSLDIETKAYVPFVGMCANRKVSDKSILFSCVFKSDICCINKDGVFNFLPIHWGEKFSLLTKQIPGNSDMNVGQILELIRENKISTHYSSLFYTNQYIVFKSNYPRGKLIFYNYLEQKIMFGIDHQYVRSLFNRGLYLNDILVGVHGEYFLSYLNNDFINTRLNNAKKMNDTATVNKIKRNIPYFNINNNPVVIRFKIYE